MVSLSMKSTAVPTAKLLGSLGLFIFLGSLAMLLQRLPSQTAHDYGKGPGEARMRGAEPIIPPTAPSPLVVTRTHELAGQPESKDREPQAPPPRRGEARSAGVTA